MAERRSYVGRLLFMSSLACLVWSAFPRAVKADKPYFVTYDDEMEEPGNLDASTSVQQGIVLQKRPEESIHQKNLVREGFRNVFPWQQNALSLPIPLPTCRTLEAFAPLNNGQTAFPPREIARSE